MEIIYRYYELNIVKNILLQIMIQHEGDVKYV